MRFMVLMIPGDRKNIEAGVMSDGRLIAAIMKYNEDLARGGILLALDGLYPTSKGARVSFTAGKPSVTDGPFTEVRELIGGYWLWQVKSKQEAIEWAKRCPAAPGDVLEIRQVFEPSDFNSEVAAQEAELLGEIGKQIDSNQALQPIN
jgi:hypothetical protein